MDVILPAVEVRKLHMAYNKKSPVLQGIDMLVKRGHIYGLLGPSGCGKTTLLKVVIGRLKPQQGRVNVLGYKPGTVESQIPGSRIGYMPQELSLYQDFTISETLHFFGRVHSMNGNEIKERTDFLLNFLDLPSADRKVCQLSGGQQRRVSLAVALLHSPEILILDEPTVGVDPLLRQRIWDHLVGISSTNHTSIIITTHYIEEARSANVVGLMRGGRLLAEGPPDSLLTRFKQTSLEDVFLHLCVLDDAVEDNSIEYNHDTISEVSDDTKPLVDEEFPVATSTSSSADNHVSHADVPDVAMVDGRAADRDGDVRIFGPVKNKEHPRSYRFESTISYYTDQETCAHTLKSCCSGFPKGRNIGALFIKNCNQLKRRIGFLLFQFLLPAIQISIYCLSIGGTPKDLPVQIVNLDQGYNYSVFGALDLKLNFAQAFLSKLDKDVINPHYASNLEDGKEFVRNGTSWCVLHFGRNFSQDSFLRFKDSSKDPTVLNGSTLDIWMDSTSQQLTITIQAKVIQAYQDIPDALASQVKKQFPDFPVNMSLFNAVDIPIRYNKPIYGLENETFLDFVAPGIVSSIIYFSAIGLTTMSLVVERKEGLFERSLVSGVTVTEIMLGHILTQFLVMAVQTTVLLIFAFIVYGVYNAGPMIVTILFTLTLGMTGMCLGFLVSSVTRNEVEATQLSLALVFPFLLISGILWPIEAMPHWLQYISICTPLTLPVEGLRSVVGRGWDLTYYVVWRGFVIGLSWAIGFLLLSLLFAKIKRIN